MSAPVSLSPQKNSPEDLERKSSRKLQCFSSSGLRNESSTLLATPLVIGLRKKGTGAFLMSVVVRVDHFTLDESTYSS
jgi:hypothetical protein